MGDTLTNFTESPQKTMGVLTSKKNSNSLFKISIEESLESNFCFKKLNPAGTKQFHTFLEKTVGKKLNFDQVEGLYKRKNDKQDKHSSGVQIIHYGDSTGFRMHGYLRNGYFVVTRIDYNHKKHK